MRPLGLYRGDTYHPLTEGPEVFLSSADVPVNCILSDFAKPDAAILHRRRQLLSTEDRSLPILICGDGITAPADLLSTCHSVGFEPYPPDPGAQLFFIDSGFLFVIFLGIPQSCFEEHRKPVRGVTSGTSRQRPPPLLAQIRPPCDSTIDLRIARPCRCLAASSQRMRRISDRLCPGQPKPRVIYSDLDLAVLAQLRLTVAAPA
jgi:hypothetical protein